MTEIMYVYSISSLCVLVIACSYSECLAVHLKYSFSLPKRDGRFKRQMSYLSSETRTVVPRVLPRHSLSIKIQLNLLHV